jgi:hypothetical protein
LGTRQFPEPLRDAGIHLELLVDNFDSGTPDIDWIPVVAMRRWVVLTHDKRMRHNRLEQDTIMSCQSRVIVISSGSTRAEMASLFLASMDRVLAFIQQHEPPFIARLYRNRIELWLDLETWLP